MALVTILAREMRLKFFEVDQAMEMLRVALVTILAREMRLKFLEVDQRLEMLRVPLVTIVERFSKPNIRFGSGRTRSKIVSKFRLTQPKITFSKQKYDLPYDCMPSAAALVSSCRKSRSSGVPKNVLCQTVQVRRTPSAKSSITGDPMANTSCPFIH